MRFKKELLSKSPLELSDEELRAIGKHCLKHPVIVSSKKLYKCISCKNLMWCCCLGENLWECLKSPVNDLSTDGDKLLNNRQISHWRRCEEWRDNNLS